MAVCESIWSFCVYDDPSADLCLHKDLYLANVHHRAVKRDGVQSIRIEQESIPMSLLGREACSAKASMLPESHLHSAK